MLSEVLAGYTVEERQHAENSSLPCLFSNEDEHGSNKKKKGTTKKTIDGQTKDSSIL